MIDMTEAIAATLRFLIASVFLISSIAKARRASAFVETIIDWGLAPRRVARILAWAVIAAELSVGICLVTGIATGAAAIAALALLGIFTSVAAWQILHGQRASCNCFGFLQRLGPRVLMRNVGLMILTAQLAVVSFSAPGDGDPVGTWLLHLTPAVTALGLAVLTAASWELSAFERAVIPRRGQ
jgi:uncharacterized membrane protein YphA (DoxX/SURF4 family)